MAVTHEVTLTTYIDAELGTLSVSPSSLTVAQGDSIQFRYSALGEFTTTVGISGFSTARYNSGTNLSFTTNNEIKTRIVVASATLGTHSLTVTANGITGSRTLSVTIVSSTDTTPDAFSFTNLSSINPSQVIESNSVTITGINTPVSVSATNSASFMINNDGVWRTTGTISNNQKLRVRQTAPSTYSTSKSTTVTVGGSSSTWQITTSTDPSSGQTINFPVQTSGTVKLSDVKSFFGGTSGPSNLRAYLKGQGYVPNISKNAGVPSSGALSLQDFVGSGTSLYFLRYPASLGAGANTSNGAKVISVSWNFLSSTPTTNPQIGYASIATGCQYRYKVTRVSGSTVTSSVSGSSGVWSAWGSTTTITLSFSAPNYSESENAGYVDFEIRSPWDPTKVLSARANYSLFAYGP